MMSLMGAGLLELLHVCPFPSCPSFHPPKFALSPGPHGALREVGGGWAAGGRSKQALKSGQLLQPGSAAPWGPRGGQRGKEGRADVRPHGRARCQAASPGLRPSVTSPHFSSLPARPPREGTSPPRGGVCSPILQTRKPSPQGSYGRAVKHGPPGSVASSPAALCGASSQTVAHQIVQRRPGQFFRAGAEPGPDGHSQEGQMPRPAAGGGAAT